MRHMITIGLLVGIVSGCAFGIVSGLFAPTAIFWQIAGLAGAFFGGLAGGLGGLISGLLSLAIKNPWISGVVAAPLIFLPLLLFGYIMMEGIDRHIINAFQAFAAVVTCASLAALLTLSRRSFSRH